MKLMKKDQKTIEISRRTEPIRHLTQAQIDLIDQLFDGTKADVRNIMEHQACFVADTIKLMILNFGIQLCDIFMHEQ